MVHTVIDEEVVLLSQVISHNCNIGYELCRNLQLKFINGIRVVNLKQLKQIIDSATNEALSEKISGILKV